MFIFGVCCNGRWNVAYIYLTEFLTEQKIKVVAPWINVSAAYPIIISSFTFQFLTRNTLYYEITALTITILFALAVLLFMPETPKYLISHKKFDAARKSFERIANVNKAIQTNFSCFDFEMETVQESDVTENQLVGEESE